MATAFISVGGRQDRLDVHGAVQAPLAILSVLTKPPLDLRVFRGRRPAPMVPPARLP